MAHTGERERDEERKGSSPASSKVGAEVEDGGNNLATRRSGRAAGTPTERGEGLTAGRTTMAANVAPEMANKMEMLTGGRGEIGFWHS